jgi:hypothetical protein
MHSFPVLIAKGGTSNKCDNCDEVREGYSGVAITHLELVFIETARARVIKQGIRISLDPSGPRNSCSGVREA